MRKGAAALGRCDVMAGKYCAYFSPLGFRRRSAGRSDGTCALRCKQGSTVMQGSSETVVSGQHCCAPCCVQMSPYPEVAAPGAWTAKLSVLVVPAHCFQSYSAYLQQVLK